MTTLARAIPPHMAIRKHYQTDPDKFVSEVTELIESRKVPLADYYDRFSVTNLCRGILGDELFFESLHPKFGRTAYLMEADAVKYSHFSNITGQIFFSMVKEAYENEEFIFSKLIPTKPSNIQDMEKIPGISGLGDMAEVVMEAQPFPTAGVSEDYIEISAKQKRGFVVPVTKEAIYGDLTGKLLEMCKQHAYWLGYNKEVRLIDCLIDENGGAKSAALGGHRYHWKGTSYATYQSTTPWVNIVTSNGLENYKDVENAWIKLKNMRDPYTGAPILFNPTHLIVNTDLAWTASNVLNATQTWANPNLSAGNTNNIQILPNPVNTLMGGLQLVTSALLKDRGATDTDWWLGNPGKAFAYFSNWEIVTEEAPGNSAEAFHRDIVMQFKASEKGVCATLEPRAMVENQA